LKHVQAGQPLGPSTSLHNIKADPPPGSAGWFDQSAEAEHDIQHEREAETAAIRLRLIRLPHPEITCHKYALSQPPPPYYITPPHQLPRPQSFPQPRGLSVRRIQARSPVTESKK
jgi:hypothetical protein